MNDYRKKDTEREKRILVSKKAKNAAVRDKTKTQFNKGFFPLRYSLIQFL